MRKKNVLIKLTMSLVVFWVSLGSLNAQRLQMKGVVVDEQNNPLIGVNVTHEKSSRGTVTDIDGNFTISIPRNSTLVFSYIGFQTQGVFVDGNSNFINVVLKEDSELLDELVVVGYGTVRKSDLTGAVGRLDFENVNTMPLTDINQALAGQVAGVNVMSSSGTPGGSFDIQIRGISTIGSGSQPLYVLDGIPLQSDGNMDSNPLSFINPGDIESVDILKDASAAAIYGSRASNGVVMITTKTGKRGMKISVDIKSGVQQVTNVPDILSPREFAEFAIEARNNSWTDRGGNVDDPDSERNNNTQTQYFKDFLDSGQKGTDWLNEIFRIAPFQDYQITASGGTDKVRYLVSGGYLKEDGIVKNSGFQRFSLRANINADLTSKLKLTVKFSPTFTNQDFLPAAGRYHGANSGIVQAALLMNPILPVYDPNSLSGYSVGVQQDYGMANVENPVAKINLLKDWRRTLRMVGSVFLDYEISKDFNFRVTAAGNSRSNFNTFIVPSVIAAYAAVPPRDNAIVSNSGNVWNWQTSSQLTYQKEFSKKHNLTALAVFEMEKQENNNVNARADGTWTDDIITVDSNLSADLRAGQSNITEWSLLSWIGRINYDYKGKYLVTTSIRTDGSSRFAERWGTFPSASAAWRISQEEFMKNVNWLSNLKLRASYGLTGNNAIGVYRYLSLIGGSNYPLGSGLGNVSSGTKISSYNNPNLTWEKTQQADVGIEVGLLKGRIALEVDYYKKDTKDLLLNMELPGVSGYRRTMTNIGEIENKGWEFTLNTRNLTGAFKWRTNLNLSVNRQKVLALGPEGDPLWGSSLFFSNTHLTEIGKPMGQFYGLKVIGVFRDQAQVDELPGVISGVASSRPGEFIFENVDDSDKEITLDDRTIIGNPHPDFIFGFTNNFSYKNFGLQIFLRGSVGGDVINMNFANTQYLVNTNQHVKVKNRWRSPEEPGDGKSPRLANLSRGILGASTLNSSMVEDASFVNIQNVTLDYNIPKRIISKWNLQNIRVFASVQNLHMFTNYSAFNPEAALEAGSTLSPGVDWGNYPLSRTTTMGLNITF